MGDLNRILTDDLVERCARAAFKRAGGKRPLTWALASAFVRRSWCDTARAVLEEALRPPPDPPVLDGQEPLI